MNYTQAIVSSGWTSFSACVIKLSMVSVLLSSLGFSGGAYYRVVNVADNDTLSIRRSPSVSAQKIGSLQPYDTGITINRCQRRAGSTWCDIDFLPDDIMFFERGFPTMRGGKWVNRRYLKQASDIIYTQAIQYRQNQNIFRVTGVSPTDTLNVHRHPRNSAQKIGHLKHNDVGIIAAKCQRVGRSRWCYVAYDYEMRWVMGPGSTKVPYAKLGWVNMRYLKLDNSHDKNRLPMMVFPGEQ